jgi:hypothetical protein
MSEETEDFKRGLFEGNVLAKLGSIEAKLDVLNSKDQALERKMEQNHDIAMAEINVLRSWKAMVMGAGAVVSLIGGVVGSEIIAFFKK